MAAALSKAAALLVVVQLLLAAAAAAPASATAGLSPEVAGASRRLMQAVSCVARGVTVSDCSRPGCDAVNDACATVGDGLGGVFHACVPKSSCGVGLVVCN
jgi:hypothetical protein